MANRLIDMNAINRISRRAFCRKSAWLAGGLTGLCSGLAGCIENTALVKPAGQPIPVILATDIGDDIDDTWALGFLLRSPELNLKLAVTEYGRVEYRAKLLAKFLQATGHSHVPVGLGSPNGPTGVAGLAPWVNDYALSSYPGQVHADGVGAMIDLIMHSKEQVAVIDIGPTPTAAAALTREPRIATRARFVGMDGSVRVGYGESKTISEEWNVKADVMSSRKTLSAPWDITITPLDTCGSVQLAGERYQRLLKSPGPVASTIIENYRIWSRSNNHGQEAQQHSSVLFDTVAVYLAFSQEFCQMERLDISVSDDGFTRIDDRGKPMNVATRWKNLDAFRDLLTNRLLGT
jgi:inosine-uridine nucleoside N-ribohydrolase